MRVNTRCLQRGKSIRVKYHASRCGNMKGKPMHEILTQVSDSVMRVSFNRTERKNSLTNTMYEALSKAIDEAGRDAAVKVPKK